MKQIPQFSAKKMSIIINRYMLDKPSQGENILAKKGNLAIFSKIWVFWHENYPKILKNAKFDVASTLT